MSRKKKLIWFEQETMVGGAGEARQRGTSQGAVRPHRHQSEPFYGPVTVEADDDDPPDPDALRHDVG